MGTPCPSVRLSVRMPFPVSHWTDLNKFGEIPPRFWCPSFRFWIKTLPPRLAINIAAFTAPGPTSSIPSLHICTFANNERIMNQSSSSAQCPHVRSLQNRFEPNLDGYFPRIYGIGGLYFINKYPAPSYCGYLLRTPGGTRPRDLRNAFQGHQKRVTRTS